MDYLVIYIYRRLSDKSLCVSEGFVVEVYCVITGVSYLRTCGIPTEIYAQKRVA